MMIDHKGWIRCTICGLEMRTEFYNIPEYRKIMEQIHNPKCAEISKRIIKDNDFSIDITNIS